MSKTEGIVILALVGVGVYFLYQTEVAAKAAQTASQNPLGSIGTEIETWFSNLFGSSSSNGNSNNNVS